MSSNPNLSHDPLDNISSSGGHAEEGGEGNWLVSYADMMTLLVGFFVILMSFSKVDEEKFDEVRKAAAYQFGGTYEIPFGEVADRVREELKKLGLSNQFSIKQTSLGVDISLLGAVFFNLGSADLKPEAQEIMRQFVPVVIQQATDFDVIVEGHTDDNPIVPGNQIRSNWELSGMRAARVLESFLVNGIRKDRLTSVGYGDARPVVPNRDSAGNAIAENQSQNRRVVIKLVKHPQPSVEGADSPPASHPE